MARKLEALLEAYEKARGEFTAYVTYGAKAPGDLPEADRLAGLAMAAKFDLLEALRRADVASTPRKTPPATPYVLRAERVTEDAACPVPMSKATHLALYRVPPGANYGPMRIVNFDLVSLTASGAANGE